MKHFGSGLSLAGGLTAAVALVSCGAPTSSEPKGDSVVNLMDVDQGTVVKLRRNVVFGSGESKVTWLKWDEPGMRRGCTTMIEVSRDSAAGSAALPAKTRLEVQRNSSTFIEGAPNITTLYTTTPGGNGIAIHVHAGYGKRPIDTFEDCMEFSNVVIPGGSDGELPNIPVIE